MIDFSGRFRFASRLLRVWEPKYLLLFAVFCIVLSRGAIILPSHDDLQMDLSIYQEVGELVANGIDPYDRVSNLDRRTALRLNDYGAADWVKSDPGRYDYLVASNLPASTALYGIVEFVSHGNPKIWRLVFALGDVAIALAAFFLLHRAGIVLDTWGKQAIFSLAVIYYPSAISWGLIWAEDKQFQTALMLLLAGLLVGPPASRNPANALAIGVVGCLSVMFKAFGVFLAPLALQYFSDRPPRELAFAAVGAAAIFLPLVLYFDLSFISSIFNRTSSSLAHATGAGLHGSPWQLVPFPIVAYARPLTSMALILIVVVAYFRGKLDLLNLCSATCLIVACLWVVGGSMDRMNMAMIFAAFCTATLSVRSWQTLTLFNFTVQLFIYGALIARTSWLNFVDGETPDAIATTLFAASYFVVLLWPRRATDPGVAGTSMI